jgi:hypothetical protein
MEKRSVRRPALVAGGRWGAWATRERAAGYRIELSNHCCRVGAELDCYLAEQHRRCAYGGDHGGGYRSPSPRRSTAFDGVRMIGEPVTSGDGFAQ